MYIDMDAEACTAVCPGQRRATAHAAAWRVCQAGSSPCGVVESEISESRFSANKWWEHNLDSAESGFESKTEEAAGSRDPRIIMIPIRKNAFLPPTCAQCKASIAVFESDENRQPWRRSKHHGAENRIQNTM